MNSMVCLGARSLFVYCLPLGTTTTRYDADNPALAALTTRTVSVWSGRPPPQTLPTPALEHLLNPTALRPRAMRCTLFIALVSPSFPVSRRPKHAHGDTPRPAPCDALTAPPRASPTPATRRLCFPWAQSTAPQCNSGLHSSLRHTTPRKSLACGRCHAHSHNTHTPSVIDPRCHRLRFFFSLVCTCPVLVTRVTSLCRNCT